MAEDDAPVSLEDYAFVSAAVSDGLPVEDVLEHRGVDPNAWARAELYWLERLMDDVAEGNGMLTLELGELSARARKSWERPVPPLDDDLQSWVDWSRAFAAQADPLGWLKEQGLVPADLLRIQARWTERLNQSEALRKELGELAERPPEPVEVPRPPPLALPKKKSDGTQFLRALSDEDLGGALPFAAARGDSEAPVYRAAPDLLAPLPEPPLEEGSLDGTAQFDPLALSWDLPFFETDPLEASVGAMGEASTEGDPDEAARDAAPTTSATPSPSYEAAREAAPRPAATPPQPSFSRMRESAAPHDLGRAHDRPAAPERPEAAIDATAVGGIPAFVEEILPFEPSRAPAPPAASAVAPHPLQGATAFVSVADLGLAATPFGEASASVDVTAPGGIPAVSDPIPFSGRTPAPPPVAREPARSSGTALVSSPSGEAPLPFVSAAAGEPPLVEGGLTLRQLASLMIEMELSVTRIGEVLAAYGLNLRGFQAHKAAFRELVAADPSAQTRFDEARDAYRRWRKQQP